MRHILVICWSLIVCAPLLSADEPAKKPEQKQEQKSDVVKATFLITGLHCPPCTTTVERSLQGVKGVKSIKVDWNSKNARVEFDEQIISAQRLSASIAGTPHMMGGNMQYGGWLAVKIGGLKADDTASWDRVKGALAKVPGVKQVAVYPTRSGVGVEFDSKGELTSRKLMAALEGAGFKASNY